MHEFSLVKALLKQVETVWREQSAERVVAIRVSVGEFSGVEPELFQYAYESLISEAAFGDAQLQLDRVALKSVCDECGHEFAVQRFRFECPTCHSHEVTITQGQELVLESVTLEQQDIADHDPANNSADGSVQQTTDDRTDDRGQAGYPS